jgi:RNA polymerase sigma-70 factor (ECF subfamily)
MNGASLRDPHTADRVMAVGDDGVLAAQIDSPVAFQNLYALYSGRLYKTIAGITKNPQDSEDALQDTFLRAYLAIHTFQGKSGIYSWLTRIAINSALMILRRQRVRPEVLFDPQPDSQLESHSIQVIDNALNPEEACDLNQRHFRTLSAIRRLDPRLRAPIRMQLMHGSSMREISHALNISVAAVKARLYRARKRLSGVHGLDRSARTTKGLVCRERGR